MPRSVPALLILFTLAASAFGATLQVDEDFDPWTGTISPDGIWRIAGVWTGTGGNVLDPNLARLSPTYSGDAGSGFLSLSVQANALRGSEIQTLPGYGYGYYETRMKVSDVPGVCASFFWIEAPGYGSREWDIEFLTNESWIGSERSGKVHFTIHPTGRTHILDLPFNPAREFHRYGFLWTAGRIAFTIDGQIVHSFADTSLNSTAKGYIMMNMWTGNPNWGGGPPSQQATSVYDWVKFYPGATAVPDDGGGATAPVLSTQPQDRTVQVGQSATFSVVATASPAPTYQWQRNATDIPGATAASYTTPPSSLSDDGASYRVVVRNSAGSVISQPATLRVNATNQAPVASAQSVTTLEGTATAITLAATDADGDPVSFAIVTQPAHGSLSGSGATRSYSPIAGYTGTDSFTFRATDSHGAVSNTATVTIAITAQGGAETLWGSMTAATIADEGTAYELGTVFSPTVAGRVTGIRIHVATSESGVHTARLWNNTTDTVIGGPYSFSVGTPGWHSYPLATPISLRAGSSYTVAVSTGTDPGRNYVIGATALASAGSNGLHLEYPANAGVYTTTMGTRPTQSFQSLNYLRDIQFVATGSSNTTPVALAQSLSTPQDTATAITLTATDADGDPLTYAIVADPAHGSLSGSGATRSYTPATGYTGTDSFSFRATDSRGAVSNTATVQITVGAASASGYEAGVVSVTQDDRGSWHRVLFAKPILDPIVIAQVMTYNGSQPVTVRVRDITQTGFEFQMQEWLYLDGYHVAEDVGWFACPRGSTVLDDGRSLLAGRSTVGDRWTDATFSATLADPIVLAQVTTMDDSRAVAIRIQAVTNTGFQVKLQGDEAQNKQHGSEAVDWIAIELGEGRLQALRTADAITHDWSTLLADANRSGTAVLAGMQSEDGGDTAVLRLRDAGQAIEVKVEEEQSQDSETKHTSETVGAIRLPIGDSSAVIPSGDG